MDESHSRLLPEQTFPSGESSTFEQRMFKNTLNTSKSRDHIDPVVVELPELTVVSLIGPPERIRSKAVELLEMCPQSPSFVVGEGMSVLLEERIDTGYTSVPTALQVLKGESPIARRCLFSLQGVLRPHSSRVEELCLPWLQVSVEVGNKLVLLMCHTGSEVGNAAAIGLLRPPKIRLRNKDEAH